MRTLLILAVNTGMRRGEMLNLKWHDIDYALGVIYLLRTKNGDHRDVPMNTTVVTALKEHPKHPTSDYIFCGPEGLPLKNIDKRYKKLPKIRNALAKRPTIKIHGSKKAKTMLVGWGSTKGAILEALQLLQKEKITASFLQVLYLEPFPAKQVNKMLEGKHPILIENNQTAQLGSLIHEYTNQKITKKILRYDGRPFNPLSLTRHIKEAL